MRTVTKLHSNFKHDCFVNEPKVIWLKEFHEDSFKKFVDDFEIALQIGQPIIPIVIDSYGGQIYSLNGMISVIKSSPVPVATILLSKAMSCGADLFTCGTEGYRYIAPYATIMIHDAASGVWGKVEEVKSDAKETERLNDLGYEILAKNCGKPKDYFKNIVHEKGHADWFIDANEALKHNLANHIGVPTFSVTARLEFNLK